jgi:hypothetical protein
LNDPSCTVRFLLNVLCHQRVNNTFLLRFPCLNDYFLICNKNFNTYSFTDQISIHNFLSVTIPLHISSPNHINCQILNPFSYTYQYFHAGYTTSQGDAHWKQTANIPITATCGDNIRNTKRCKTADDYIHPSFLSSALPL